MDGFQGLIEKLEAISIPGQMMLAVDNPFLRMYFTVVPDDETERLRFERHLEAFFNGEMEKIDSTQRTTDELSEMLKNLSNYTRYTKVNVTSKLVHAKIDTSRQYQNLQGSFLKAICRSGTGETIEKKFCIHYQTSKFSPSKVRAYVSL